MGRVGKFLLSFVIFAAVCYGGLVWFVNHEVAKGIDQAVAETPGMTLEYTDLSVSIFDHTVTLDNVAVKWAGGQSFFAEEISVLKYDQKNPTPHYLQARAQGAVISATRANLGEYVGLLKLIGLTALSGDLEVGYSYNPTAKNFTLDTFRFDEKTLGDLTLSGVVTNIDVDALRPEKLVGLRLGAADLIYTDKSLIEKVMLVLGQSVGTGIEATRAQFSGELGEMVDFADKQGNGVAADAINGFKNFVQNSGTLTVAARPAEPVPFIYFFMGRDFYDNLQLLNLSVLADSDVVRNNQ